MKPTMSLESEADALRRNLMSSYSPAAVRQARQDDLLLQRLGNGSYLMADIGCGDGYHAVLLAAAASAYHGFEVSPIMATAACELWRRKGIAHATVIVGDAAVAVLPNVLYDIVLCLYFTPGNIRDRSADLGLYSDAYLDRNPRFIRVLSRFHRAMKAGGRMFLTLHKDVPEAESAQVDLYESTGQHVVTAPGSRFAATSEGFWSARWTRDSLVSNLDGCGAFLAVSESVEQELVGGHADGVDGVAGPIRAMNTAMRSHAMEIFVGNISFASTEDDLWQLFEGFGTVERVNLILDRDTGRSRGFGFVGMPNGDEARAAIEALAGSELQGRALVVNQARPREPRPKRGSW